MKVKVLVAHCVWLFVTPWTEGSSVHGILQSRILEWVVISFSRASLWPRDWTQVSYTAGRFFIIWATREALTVFKVCYIVIPKYLPDIFISVPSRLIITWCHVTLHALHLCLVVSPLPASSSAQILPLKGSFSFVKETLYPSNTDVIHLASH